MAEISPIDALNAEFAKKAQELKEQYEERSRKLAASPFERVAEVYAGSILQDGGTPKHHLFLLAARPPTPLSWTDAKAWAAKVGGELPNLQEVSVIFGNCKHNLVPEIHWTSEAKDDAVAWTCDFNSGRLALEDKAIVWHAVAIRRV